MRENESALFLRQSLAKHSHYPREALLLTNENRCIWKLYHCARISAATPLSTRSAHGS